jgi:DNA primase
MFDSDAAGQSASLRGFDRSVPGDLDLRVALLPAGRDPAELADSGEVATITGAIEDSKALLQFRLETELDRFDLDEPEARGRAVRATADLVALHPDAVARHEYAVFLARKTGVELAMVAAAVEEAARKTRRPLAAESRPAAPPDAGRARAETELLRLMLANHPGLVGLDYDASVFADEANAAAHDLLRPVLEALGPGEPPDLGAVLSGRDEALAERLSALALADRPLADPGEIVKRLEAESLEDRIRELRRRVAGLDPDREPEVYSDVFEELIALERRRRELRSHQ